MSNPLNSQLITEHGVQDFEFPKINSVLVDRVHVDEGVIHPLGGITNDVNVMVVHVLMLDGAMGSIVVGIAQALKLADELTDWIESQIESRE